MTPQEQYYLLQLQQQSQSEQLARQANQILDTYARIFLTFIHVCAVLSALFILITAFVDFTGACYLTFFWLVAYAAFRAFFGHRIR